MSKHALVFAGGDFDATYVSAQMLQAEIVVGVDHGISHCLRTGLVPDIIIGDFDSVDMALLSDARLVDVQMLRHPVRKNSSDLELALQCLSEMPVSDVTLLGISGGRSDHHLFNWLLPMQRSWPFSIGLVDATVQSHLVTPQHPLQVEASIGQIVSVVPLPEARGVTTQGLEYALDNAIMGAGSTLGLSNVVSATSIKVSLSTGRVLVFRVNMDTMQASN